MILTESPRRKRVTKMVAWGHWFALANIILALVISSIYIFSSPAPGSWLGNTYMLANWLGHISFVTFFGFVLFVLPSCYLVKNEKTVRLTGAIVAASGLALLAFDALVYTRTGFHISFNSVQIVRTVEETRMAEFSWKQWFYLLLLFCVWLSGQLVLANAIWRRLEKLSHYKFTPSVASFFLTCFIAGHGMHIWADAKLYQPIVKQDNLFPLSYPATAKTTMSRYGLLDLEAYKQREKLQFRGQVSGQVTRVRYPSEPVYCGIDNTRSALVFIQTDQAPLSLNNNKLAYDVAFYSLSTSKSSQQVSSIFGVPEIYYESLADKRPVLLALPQVQGFEVSVSADSTIAHPAISTFQSPYSNFEKGLHIAFMSAADIKQALSALSYDDKIIMVASSARLYANIPLKTNNASNEDIAPTLLSALGCKSAVTSYSTGRNLSAPARDWIVSTSGERIVVIQRTQRIDVMTNGNYEIINLKDNTRSSEGLNVNVLSQAVKHLSRFSTAD